MALGIKFYSFAFKTGQGVFNLSTDVLKIYLSNSAPDVANDTVKADVPEIATGFGYTGPINFDNTWTQDGAVSSLKGNASYLVTASGGSIGPFRYVVLYDDTAAGDPVICYWDIGAPITINDTGTFTFNLNDPATVAGTLQ